MRNEKDSDQKNMDENENGNHKVTPSSADTKNSDATGGGIPNPTDRVKPSSGDGLANEGTIVSYDEER